MIHSVPRVLLGVGAAMTLCQGTAAKDPTWTEFRGPSGQGYVASANVPLIWSENENVKWSVPIPGIGWSSPVVANHRIYLTSAVPIADSEDLWLSLLIFDTTHGDLIRQVDLFRHVATTAPDIHAKNSHASPTPIVEGNRIYVHFGHEGTACLDLNGNLIWANESIRYDPVHGNGGSPTLVGDVLAFSCDGREEPFVIGLDKLTGETLWRSLRAADAPKNYSFSTPLAITVNGHTQLISPGSNCVVAYNPQTGEEIWRVRYEGYSIVPRPVFADGLVYISTCFDSPITMAIQTDGIGDVTDTHVAWTENRAAPNTPSMLLINDRLYMVSDRGVASCLNAKTGETVWRERLGGNFSASPVVAGGRIYFQSEEGETIVVEAADEFNEIARNDIAERMFASLSVVNDDFLIRTETKLYRIGE